MMEYHAVCILSYEIVTVLALLDIDDASQVLGAQWVKLQL